MRSLRLYIREGCHLCEDMLADLKNILADRDVPLELFDVDATPEIQQKYDSRIPVLESAEGSCLSQFFLDKTSVIDYLDGI